MQPTASQRVCDRELVADGIVCAAGDAGRWVALRFKSVELSVNMLSKTSAHVECSRRKREPNESFEPTGMSVPLIESLCDFGGVPRRLNSSVRQLAYVDSLSQGM